MYPAVTLQMNFDRDCHFIARWLEEIAKSHKLTLNVYKATF